MQESRGCGETHSRPHTLQRWNLGLGVTEVRGNATGYNSPLNLPMNNTPRHQFNLQSRLNLTTHWEFDSGLCHYNGIPTYLFGETPIQDVPTHNRIDMGLAWRKIGGFTFSVWGHDITSGHRWENCSSLFMTSPSAVRGRSVAFQVAWESEREPASSGTAE